MMALLGGLNYRPPSGNNFRQCVGCGKPAKNGHCFKCQQESPFAWEEPTVSDSIRGRFKGRIVQVIHTGREYTGYLEGEACVGTRRGMADCREMLEKWCLMHDQPAIRVV